jgi:hypothetical protein
MDAPKVSAAVACRRAVERPTDGPKKTTSLYGPAASHGRTPRTLPVDTRMRVDRTIATLSQ